MKPVLHYSAIFFQPYGDFYIWIWINEDYREPHIFNEKFSRYNRSRMYAAAGVLENRT